LAQRIVDGKNACILWDAELSRSSATRTPHASVSMG
jgi:hypothetical protein